MTKQIDIVKDDNYKSIFNHGFVGLIDVMGDDAGIVNAARVSYGDGTKSVNEDRGLIRYLLRHKHTTPFEMVELKFHCKMPIFVARQWIRHRTANVNEYSGRYSVMVDEFYVPEKECIQPQSKTNKQGREGVVSEEDKEWVQWAITAANNSAYDMYKALLGPSEVEDLDAPYGLYDEDAFSEEFEGISREMARGVLNVNNYTEWYWKIDLHNLFHFLNLRMDSHAQYEIRTFANAMYDLLKPHIPLAVEAFEDYTLNAKTFSNVEMIVIKLMLDGVGSEVKEIAEEEGMNKRELEEFLNKLYK